MVSFDSDPYGNDPERAVVSSVSHTADGTHMIVASIYLFPS